MNAAMLRGEIRADTETEKLVGATLLKGECVCHIDALKCLDCLGYNMVGCGAAVYLVRPKISPIQICPRSLAFVLFYSEYSAIA